MAYMCVHTEFPYAEYLIGINTSCRSFFNKTSFTKHIFCNQPCTDKISHKHASRSPVQQRLRRRPGVDCNLPGRRRGVQGVGADDNHGPHRRARPLLPRRVQQEAQTQPATQHAGSRRT